MINVLFVCLGNICRSPMAQAIFEDKIEKKGLNKLFKTDSAGTANYHIGSQPDPRTIKILNNHRITFRHAARQAQFEDAETFNYILAMDRNNFEDLKNILPADYHGLKLMLDYPASNKLKDVPDPYYGGSDGFEQVYQILNESIEYFIEEIIKNNNLKNE